MTLTTRNLTRAAAVTRRSGGRGVAGRPGQGRMLGDCTSAGATSGLGGVVYHDGDLHPVVEVELA